MRIKWVLEASIGRSSETEKKGLHSPTCTIHADEDEEAINLLRSFDVGEPQARAWREHQLSAIYNDFRVEILEFEGKLDPDAFLELVHNI